MTSITTTLRARTVLERVTASLLPGLPPVRLIVEPDAVYTGPAFLQVEFDGVNSYRLDEAKTMAGRRWVIEHDATDEEIVQTALAAVLTVVEHEVREAFLVDGQPLYGPHQAVLS